MKAAVFTALATAQLAVAHSGVWKVFVDGVEYPAFDTRLDGRLGAKRVEWSFSDPGGMPWGPVKDVSSPAFTCGQNAKPPSLKVQARAGTNVTVQWSGIVRTHYGPRMSYLAYLPTPDTKPQELSFFKINERGYNVKAKLWSNEELINADRKDTFQLPSDIKSGTYVLRTELLALHYAPRELQWYSHCFNLDIKSEGTATPAGVRFPGGYKKTDPGVSFALYKAGGAQNDWASYKIPGPPKYAGKYEAPTGPMPIVSDLQRGAFPAAFQAKYDALKKKEDKEGLEFNDKLNAAQASLQHNQVKSEANLSPIFAAHFATQRQFNNELAQLKKEAVKLGIAQ